MSSWDTRERIDPDQVVRYVGRYPGKTTGQIAAALGWSRQAIRYTLIRLEHQGRVSAVVSGQRWRHWYPAGHE